MGDGVYAIAGGKGGVGKTTTAINLGVVLGQAGYDVVVVDADLAMADVGRRLNVDHGQGLHSVLAGETTVRAAVVDGPGGLALLPGDRDLASFADASPERLPKVYNLLRVAYDVVLVDTAPGLQNESAITYREVDGVALVTTPEPTAVADTEKAGRLAADAGADLLGTVVTHGEGQQARLATDELDGDLLAVVPHHSTGGPITAETPDDAAADAYRQVAAALPAVTATAVVPDGDASETVASPGGTDDAEADGATQTGAGASDADVEAEMQLGAEIPRARTVAGEAGGDERENSDGSDS
ncbi:MinD/ParA family ATP-binding protein [Halorientalis sp.]|uniref:MinD/ParA family ATP-binding protein n=1 Tax=Halorientalis sp. TaxID=1931229 RepID=UPI002629C57A|nr:P-loop NTPase [Halorientalis sp.]